MEKPGEIYALYLPDAKNYTIDLNAIEGVFTIQWFNPLVGGELQNGSVLSVKGGGTTEMGAPPLKQEHIKNQDWVVLIKKSH
ncbi:hypothetical protein BFP77_12090 [Maribacter sp. 4U21]|uniref:putative collagen-binding domain-containing protein n=1 Tax=Maribacter sp. 4U21 TaxID=1889779 RepID=UPI000C14C857|nr:putative collagen-binding domain-containing protein [Maribacter sp. 4U21]PIB27396.1 hypothetical protein BFP77_12090 [Maribacter sp. 4U21]